jgi:uncharacterized protein with GYD domain
VAFYSFLASYTASGTQGLMKDGGSKREAAIKQLVTDAGGKLHAMYFAFGEFDVIGIVEFPDPAAAAAMSLAVNASGAVTLRTTLLLTPAELDAAAKKTVPYRAPGA